MPAQTQPALAVALIEAQPATALPIQADSVSRPIHAADSSAPHTRRATRPAIPAQASSTENAGMASDVATSSSSGSTPAAAAPDDAAVGPIKTAASIPAHYAAGNKKPDYPLLARRMEEQGTVVLRVLVREDGRAGRVVVKQTSGHTLLDESARTAVATWRFQPASMGNVAIAEWYQVAIPFTLYN